MADQMLDYYREGHGLSRQDLAGLGLKLLGVYALLRMLNYLPIIAVGFAPGQFGGPDRWLMMVAYGVPLACYAGAASVLLIWSGKLAGWILPGQAMVFTGRSISARDLQAVVLCLIGVAVLVWTVPTLVADLIHWLQSWQPWMGRGGGDGWVLLEPGLRFVIGLVLVLQGDGLARLWQVMRTGGTRGEEKMTNDDDVFGAAKRNSNDE